jgi:hypothetical protein
MKKHAIQVVLAALLVLAGVSLRLMSTAIDTSSEGHLGFATLGVAPLPALSPDNDSSSGGTGSSSALSPQAVPAGRLLAIGTSPVPMPPPQAVPTERLLAIGTSPVPMPPPQAVPAGRLLAIGTSPVPMPPPQAVPAGRLLAIGTSPVPMPPPQAV